MIRAAGVSSTGTPFVFLGLEPQNINRLREGQPIKVNLRHLDPDGPPVEQLPDVDVIIFFGGQDEIRQLTEKMNTMNTNRKENQ